MIDTTNIFLLGLVSGISIGIMVMCIVMLVYIRKFPNQEVNE